MKLGGWNNMPIKKCKHENCEHWIPDEYDREWHGYCEMTASEGVMCTRNETISVSDYYHEKKKAKEKK
jgi:hypothetical protein